MTAFIDWLAGCYDTYDFAKAITSGSRFYGDDHFPGSTDKPTYEVFRNHLLDLLTLDSDRDTLTPIFVEGGKSAGSEIHRLTVEQGMLVYNLLKTVPFEEANSLFQRLPHRTFEWFRRVSPSTIDPRAFVGTISGTMRPKGSAEAFEVRRRLAAPERQGYPRGGPLGGRSPLVGLAMEPGPPRGRA